MQTLSTESAAIHSLSSMGMLALVGLMNQDWPPFRLLLTKMFTRPDLRLARLATYRLWSPFSFFWGHRKVGVSTCRRVSDTSEAFAGRGIAFADTVRQRQG